MDPSNREFWTFVHGMVLVMLFLLAFSGGLAGLLQLSPRVGNERGPRERPIRLRHGIGPMALVAWLTVITGTWIVYPWYREDLSSVGDDRYAGHEGLQVPNEDCSPRDFLLSETSGDHRVLHTPSGSNGRSTSPGSRLCSRPLQPSSSSTTALACEQHVPSPPRHLALRGFLCYGLTSQNVIGAPVTKTAPITYGRTAMSTTETGRAEAERLRRRRRPRRRYRHLRARPPSRRSTRRARTSTTFFGSLTTSAPLSGKTIIAAPPSSSPGQYLTTSGGDAKSPGGRCSRPLSSFSPSDSWGHSRPSSRLSRTSSRSCG